MVISFPAAWLLFLHDQSINQSTNQSTSWLPPGGSPFLTHVAKLEVSDISPLPLPLALPLPEEPGASGSVGLVGTGGTASFPSSPLDTLFPA